MVTKKCYSVFHGDSPLHSPIKGECGTTLPTLPTHPSPSPYKRRMWDCAKANKDEIWECLSSIDWDSKFEKISVNDMVIEFMTTVLDIWSRFIADKIAICNDKDPPWITPEIETEIKGKHRIYNKYVKHGRRLNE